MSPCPQYNRFISFPELWHLVDGQLTDLLTELMVHSDVGFAELVLKSIAQIEGGVRKSNPVVTGKDKEMAVLNKQFEETLGKLVSIGSESTSTKHLYIYFMAQKIYWLEQSGVELDQELERARGDDKRLKQLVCDNGAELQRLKDVKANNRKEISRRRKDNRQKINKLT